MKLERLFKVENSKLYTMSGEEVSLTGKAFPIKWSSVESVAEEYSEDFLAKLRDELKTALDNNDMETLRKRINELEQAAAYMQQQANAGAQTNGQANDNPGTNPDDVVDADFTNKNS